MIHRTWPQHRRRTGENRPGLVGITESLTRSSGIGTPPPSTTARPGNSGGRRRVIYTLPRAIDADREFWPLSV
jgi:hypothetical protein